MNSRILITVILLLIMGLSSTMADAAGKKCSHKHFLETSGNNCKTVKAKSHNKVRYGCKGKYKGKSLYRISKIRCGVCPDDYSRNTLLKKSGPKACINLKYSGEAKFSKMIPSIRAKCKKGEFKHKGVCKSCPVGTKRKHVAGVDTGWCKNLNYKK